MRMGEWEGGRGFGGREGAGRVEEGGGKEVWDFNSCAILDKDESFFGGVEGVGGEDKGTAGGGEGVGGEDKGGEDEGTR